MAPVTTKNTSDPDSSDDAFLFINISGPTDGRHRGPSTQRRIRQHVMRDITKAQRKPPPNRRVKVQRATLTSKDNSKNKTRHANTFDASALDSHSEEPRGHGSATGTVPGSAIDGSPPDTPERGLTELQKPTTPVSSRLDRHPLAVLYQSLAGTSRFPAYSLAYAVVENVKVNRKL